MTVAPTTKDAIKPALLLGVLGVVYGDIGTSPLYSLKATLMHFSGHGLDRWEIMGVLSLVFWVLLLVVTVKYVMFVMRADNKGEGGILALMALAQRVSGKGKTRKLVVVLGVIGACLFFGDGIITPAISVLSAVEGLKVVNPHLESYVVPISLAVIAGLFVIQSYGTSKIGRIFGPIMAVWFATLGALGLIEILREPAILAALSPTYAVGFAVRYPIEAFIAMGSVVLVVTGAEALYADMGHFGARPIRLAWSTFVLPCLTLNYLGQGALILSDQSALSNPFFNLAPDWFQLPLVFLATAATVIASQSMISGAYSIARHCVQLGFSPRLIVRHTSETEEGQIYMPQVNALLAAGVFILVVAFRNSDALAAAYGLAVTGTFLATSVLAMVVFRRKYGWSRWAAGSVFGFFFLLDTGFFVSNVLKIPDGGWVPIVLALGLLALMTTWKRGRELMFARWRQDSLPLSSFLARLPQSRTIRVPGIAVFMTGNSDFVPTALLHNLKHNKVLHEKVLFVTVMNEDVPEIDAEQRAEVHELAPGMHRVLIRYGFKEDPNVPRVLESLNEKGISFNPMQVSYFLGRETVVPALVPKMPLWRHWLFIAMSRNAVSATEFFRIPYDRVVELGVRVAI